MHQGFSVSIRIRHPSADPVDLTKHIGMQPQHCWRAGDRRPASAEGSRLGTYRETYWLAELSVPSLPGERPEPPPSVERMLALAMHQFDRCPSFWRQFIAEGGSESSRPRP
jgi:hypothetical protein